MYAPKIDKLCPSCGGVMTRTVEGTKVKRNRWRCRPCYNAKHAPIARAYYHKHYSKKARELDAIT